MSFKDRLHVLSDQLEGDAPVVWRRDWLSLLALTLVTLLTGPWPVLALWTQRWNVKALWDAKDHWDGTKLCAMTFVLIDILLIGAFIRFRPASFMFGWPWLFYRVLCWWLWWALLTPAFALVAEYIDPRTQKIRRVLLPREHLPEAQAGSTGKAATRSPGKKKAATRKKGKGRPVPLWELLTEEKAEMERQRTQINFIQPQPLSSEARETQPAEPAPPDSQEIMAATRWDDPIAGAASVKKAAEPGKPESLDDLF